MRCCLVFALAIASSHLPLATSHSPGADWPQFRGPDSSGVSVEKDLPVKWSATENIRWKAELPGRGLSSPIITGNRVFVTACSGVDQTRLHVLCFDAETGKKLWDRQFWSTGLVGCHKKTSMAAPTPATDGQRVYALFATCDLACLDLDGNLVWYRSLTGDYPTLTNAVGMAASPIVVGPVMVMLMENAGESFALGIDKLTGKNLWKIDRERQINWTTPLTTMTAGKLEVLLQSPKELTAVDPATGTRRWGFEAKGISTIPSAVAGKGTIYLPAGDFTALKPKADGTTPEVLWTSNRVKPATASPVLYEDRIYCLKGAGLLTCAEAATGNVLWEDRVKGPFSASPVIGDGKLYAVSEEGVTTVIQLGDKPVVLASNPLGEVILGSPAISGGAIFLRSDQHLWCVGKKAK
jgi:outer membrane protein assembly factor BamB